MLWFTAHTSPLPCLSRKPKATPQSSKLASLTLNVDATITFLTITYFSGICYLNAMFVVNTARDTRARKLYQSERRWAQKGGSPTPPSIRSGEQHSTERRGGRRRRERARVEDLAQQHRPPARLASMSLAGVLRAHDDGVCHLSIPCFRVETNDN